MDARVALAAVALAAALGPLPARAAIQETVAEDDGARMIRVAPDVYAIVHDDATHEWPSGAVNWPHGNTGVVVGDDGVLVVDSTYLPRRARDDIALIRRVTDRPVRYLVNTHWHGDHTHGNGVYREVFPEVVVVGARPNRAFIELNLARWPRTATAEGSVTRAELAGYEAMWTSGRDSAGRALTDEEKARIGAVIADRRLELQGLAEVGVVPPDLVFDDALTLLVGGRRVEMRNEGRGNSPADVSVYVPDGQVLFTGDLVVHPIPYAWWSYPVAWIEVLKRLEALPVRALVPGHGPVLPDHAYTRKVRGLLETAVARATALLLEGKTTAQVVEAEKLADLRDDFVVEGDPSGPVFWDSSIAEALVDRAVACAIGARC